MATRSNRGLFNPSQKSYDLHKRKLNDILDDLVKSARDAWQKSGLPFDEEVLLTTAINTLNDAIHEAGLRIKSMATKKSRVSIPPASTPMCDKARAIHDFPKRLQHYKTCTDPRCRTRIAAAQRCYDLLIPELKK